MKQIGRRIAIIGGGPSALFMFKRLVDADGHMAVDIYERSNSLGSGMPYSGDGACDEHITNVSPNEIPEIVTSIEEWVKTGPPEIIQHYNITAKTLNEYKVLPRLFFGSYLSGQFDLLLKKASQKGMQVNVHLNTAVTDIVDKPALFKTEVVTSNGNGQDFDAVIICTGHCWPVTHEGIVPGYFDSPYPPAKLGLAINYPVAIRGSSLTAIDAIRTLARHNGSFSKRENGLLDYELGEGSEGFKLIMHSLDGLLPALRFHLEDSHLQKNAVLSDEEIEDNMQQNDGFLSLDYVFEKNFKEPFRTIDPEFYDKIRDMKLENFVASMMSLRESLDAFTLFKAEYAEAEKSIKRKESVHWKEMLAVLSFAMNYPAKHFSAEDMTRLQKVLKPLISIVIAFVPQSSARELIALYDAGLLEIISVDSTSYVEACEQGGATVHYVNEENKHCAIYYKLFIDCIGQPQLHHHQIPFESLITHKTISPALLKFRSMEEGKIAKESKSEEIIKSDSGNYYLKVPGIAINDHFQVLDNYSAANSRIYIMAVPYIGGYNPDYSGLDFCEAASLKIAHSILKI